MTYEQAIDEAKARHRAGDISDYQLAHEIARLSYEHGERCTAADLKREESAWLEA